MRGLASRLGIALITFLFGVGIASISFRHESLKTVRLLSGPPCADGIVSVELQSRVPLRISISDTACRNPHGANVQFAMENISSKPIIKYEIRSIMSYDGLVDDGIGVSTVGVENFQLHQTQTSFIGGGALKVGVEDFQPHQTQTGFIGGEAVKVGDLKGFTLTVWSVHFADGTEWTRPSSR